MAYAKIIFPGILAGMLDSQALIEIISGRKTGWTATAARWALGSLTPIYRFAIGVRNWRFDRAESRRDSAVVRRVSVPVISVGNLTTGGTGKTPLVMAIAQFLDSIGVRPAIVSRGYGALPEHRNDEAKEVEQRLPNVAHFQGADRYRMAQEAIEQVQAQAIVLDDGFQHRQLHRDLNIVLVDGTEPFGFGRLLPRGLLREPVKNLVRADLVVLTRSDLVPQETKQRILKRITDVHREATIIQSRCVPSCWRCTDGAHQPLDFMKHKKVFLFCAIGNPAGFQKTLEQLGIRIQGRRIFPDHCRFSSADLAELATSARKTGAEFLVCTHKDLVKIQSNEIGGLPILALEVDLQWGENPSIFHSLIQQAVQKATLSG